MTADERALQSYDDLAHHGYGERDELREEKEEGWRDEPVEDQSNGGREQ